MKTWTQHNFATWWSYHKNVTMTIDGSERIVGAK